MAKAIKDQAAILSKLGINELNTMQKEAISAIGSFNEVILLSPTGTGKTLAFLLPLIFELKSNSQEIQVMIITPSRELAIQIEQVMREMGTGYKVNSVYGGRSGFKDRIDIKHRPAVLIGTPGRIADHMRRETFDISHIKTLVLDEFDKSLEIGFEAEMQEILKMLPKLNKKILTSATFGVTIPEFVNLKDPKIINYLKEESGQLKIKTVIADSKDKLKTLKGLIAHIGDQNGIIFCNYKDSIQQISKYLSDHKIAHGTFFGGMEQADRERTLIKFRNGTHQILLSTDLAARGIDVPEIKFIIHYQLPSKSIEFKHRNGRTARMNSEGTAYIIQYEKDKLPDYLETFPIEKLKRSKLPSASDWTTLYISGGRKDKISKGDIAGLFFKQGKLNKGELGIIELKNDCAYVAVKYSTVKKLLPKVNNMKLKKKKVRVSVI